MALSIAWVAAVLAIAQPGDLPSPAPAGMAEVPMRDDGPFACLFQGVAPDRRTQASLAAAYRLTDGPEDGELRGGAALDSILGSVTRCGDASRWTAGQREMAQLYVLAELAREHLLRHYAAQQVDLGFLDAVLTSPPDAPRPSFDELAGRVRAQGVTGARPDSAEDIVYIYVSLAQQAEAMKAGFAVPGSSAR